MARVLIIEDDADLRETLAELLRLNGYSVQTAANGQDALQRLRSSDPPRLILLDLMMPVMNGWEFRNALANDPSLSQVPVVVLSGAADASHAGGLPGDNHLIKPVTLETVLNAVQAHC
jgi:CheY-like chemotaxis protein